MKSQTGDEPIWRSLFPYESKQIDLDGVALRYIDEGAGSPLLMVHGNPTWSFYWRELIREFSPSRRCVAVDHVGCGRSDKPQDYDYCLRQHIDNLVRLIDALDLREATLIAHDWGGAIGLGAALERADRFARLVLLNTGAFPPHFVPLRIRACRAPLLGELGLRGLNLFARAAIHMAVARPLSREAAAGLLAPYDSWRNRIAIDRFVKDIPFSTRHRTWKLLEQIERDLERLATRPAALVWGMRDWCFNPSCLARFQKLLPNAESHELAEASHYVLEDAPADVVRIVRDFLQRHDRTASANDSHEPVR